MFLILNSSKSVQVIHVEGRQKTLKYTVCTEDQLEYITRATSQSQDTALLSQSWKSLRTSRHFSPPLLSFSNFKVRLARKI